MSVYFCKNRITGALICRRDMQEVVLGDRSQVYPQLVRVLYCRTHHIDGPKFAGRTKAMATAAQRHPWEWCPECAKIKESKP